MRTKLILGTSLLMAGMIGGCGDAAVTADAATTDLGAAVADTGPVAADTGPSVTDAGPVATDTGPVVAFNVIHGCNVADYMDRSAAGDRTVASVGISYAPKCLTIAAGQSVTFNSSFSSHPLSPGRAPSQSTGTASAASPIVRTATGSTATFTFPTAGFYPYYCEFHQGGGMFGVIQVR